LNLNDELFKTSCRHDKWLIPKLIYSFSVCFVCLVLNLTMTITIYNRNWVFSFVQYDETELESLREVLSKETNYAIFKRRVDSPQKSYIKGYASFRDAYSLEKIRRLLGKKVYARVACHSRLETDCYCSQEGNFEEFGERTHSLKFNDWLRLNYGSSRKSKKTASTPKTKEVPIQPKESPKRKREEPIDEKSTKPFNVKQFHVFVFSLDS